MSGSFFLDTNVLVYAYSGTDPAKSPLAQALCAANGAWLSTQVMIEFVNVSHRKFKKSWPVIQQEVQKFPQDFLIHPTTPATILRGIQVAQRYGFSWFDALIVAAALECGCDTLYSEDLQHGQLIDSTLRVVNPFG